jgi:serine/threonine-protein kinase
MLERVAGEAYGPDWEDRGLGALARRAALLAALWPFPDGTSGATSLASTTVGSSKPGRSGRFRGGGKRNALVGSAILVALLIGGVGYRYAAADEHAAVAEDKASTPLAGPSSGILPTTTPPSLASSAPSVSVTKTATTTTTTLPADPATTTSKTPSPTPSTKTSSTPPPDTTAPTVGAVTANPTSIEAEGCKYGARTSAISVTVTDDRSGPAALKVSFSYTLGGTTSTVAMSSAGKGGAFQGTLGPLAMPRTATRIPISVVAADAAGNSAKSASPTYVTLENFCTPG